MPIVHLVVHVHNSRGDPVLDASVRVDFGTRTSPQVVPLTQPDPVFPTFETTFLAEPPQIRVLVDHRTAFPIEQDLLVTYGKTPVLKTQSTDLSTTLPRDIQLHHLGGHSRDGQVGWNLEVFITLTSVKDAKQEIKNETGSDAPTPDARLVMKLATPVLAAPPGFFNGAPVEVGANPQGELFWLQRRETPRLVGMWVPKAILDEVKKWPGTGDPRALPFHLFFHPSIPAGKDFAKSYPFSEPYVTLVRRYMLLPFVGPPKPIENNKSMIHQSVAAGKDTIIVFPAGSQKDQFSAAFLRQSSVHLLLHDLMYFLQRTQGVPLPVVVNPVAQLTMSAFSAGIRFLATVLEGRTARQGGDDFFFNRLLKEVYVLDGVFSGRGGAAELQTFTNSLKTWFRGGADGRVIRVYSQHDDWLTNLSAQIGAVTLTGRNGAREHGGAPSASAVLMPTEFLHQFMISKDPNFDTVLDTAVRRILALNLPATRGKTFDGLKRETLYAFAHHLIAGWFLGHALSLSKIK